MSMSVGCRDGLVVSELERPQSSWAAISQPPEASFLGPNKRPIQTSNSYSALEVPPVQWGDNPIWRFENVDQDEDRALSCHGPRRLWHRFCGLGGRGKRER